MLRHSSFHWDQKVQRRMRTWPGNSVLKAGRSLSCGEQSAALVGNPEQLTTGPISSGNSLYSDGEGKEKEEIKNLRCHEKESSFWMECSGVQVFSFSRHLPWWSVYIFHDSLSVTKKIKKTGLGLHHCPTDSHFQSYRKLKPLHIDTFLPPSRPTKEERPISSTNLYHISQTHYTQLWLFIAPLSIIHHKYL